MSTQFEIKSLQHQNKELLKENMKQKRRIMHLEEDIDILQEELYEAEIRIGELEAED
ncbi:MAG: hypothetical protein LBB45_03365 [Methanobrevibacter sp.]|jgi:predicted RNase H-like nuclease (RuvC/YqgF family)|nr:hypothetical protein [Candidatus Methanovirga basalitermitum]